MNITNMTLHIVLSGKQFFTKWTFGWLRLFMNVFNMLIHFKLGIKCFSTLGTLIASNIFPLFLELRFCRSNQLFILKEEENPRVDHPPKNIFWSRQSACHKALQDPLNNKKSELCYIWPNKGALGSKTVIPTPMKNCDWVIFQVFLLNKLKMLENCL